LGFGEGKTFDDFRTPKLGILVPEMIVGQKTQDVYLAQHLHQKTISNVRWSKQNRSGRPDELIQADLLKLTH
jgi:hypothetical protein